MKKSMSRRSAILGGANIAALAGATGALAAAPTADDSALGVPGDKVSADDYVEIMQLYGRYCHALNSGAMEAFVNTYVEDGEFSYGRGSGKAANDRTPPVKGREALKKTGTGGGLRHFTSNLLVTKTPEGANGSCYLILYDARVNPPRFVGTAIYDDTLVKTAEGWRFKKRILLRDDHDDRPIQP